MATTNWASLSDNIIFQTIQGPGKFSREPNGANWVEQDLLVGKGRLQKMGINLQQIDMTIRLHAFILPFSVMCTALESAYANGDVLQWVYGTGEALGDFVITSMKYVDIQDGPTGLHIARDVDITLREYAGPGVAAQTGIDAAQAAFANKVPTMTTPPPIPNNSSQSVSQSVTETAQGNTQIGNNANTLQQGGMSIDRFNREAATTIAMMQQANATAIAGINATTNMPNATGLLTAMNTVNSQTVALAQTIAAIPRGSTNPLDVAAIVASAGALNASVVAMTIAAQPMQGTVTWWKVNPYLI